IRRDRPLTHEELIRHVPSTRSQLINSIDILRARRATGLMTRDNYRTVNNITLGKYPEAK
ncbi:TPA: hypothetical protein LAS31_003055, partial [Escherichia coli]|nr:hypothetical protein [Escherichia coli]HBJ1408802.1 hypothetical protein [Escherichia coli]